MDNRVNIDWARFFLAQEALGSRLESVVGWFDDDGTSAAQAIARAADGHDGYSIIRVAGLLKVDAMQIGALSVSEIAESCELAARACLDDSAPWPPVHEKARALAKAHRQTLALFREEIATHSDVAQPKARAA
jgi:histidine phosphotransfer protein HptB